MKTTKHLRMTRGETFTETLVVTDGNGAPIDITGYTAYFAITADMKLPTALLELDSAGRGGCVLSDQSTAPGQYVATVTPAQNGAWVAAGDDDPYFYEAWVVSPGGVRIEVRALSKLALDPSFTTIP